MAAGNSVRQALQDLLREYMSNAGKIPSDQLDQAIDNMCRRTQDMRYINNKVFKVVDEDYIANSRFEFQVGYPNSSIT